MTVRVVFTMLRLGFRLAVLLVEAACWCIAVVLHLAIVAWRLPFVFLALWRGGIRCPEGHLIPLAADATYECEGCGYRYRRRGGALRCPNVECGSPNASYVFCPECGLSVRSPTRWGRP